jgi:hypothetical protein
MASLDSNEPSRSVKTIVRDNDGRQKLSNCLTDEQVRELVAVFKAGEATRLELAERFGIGRTSVAKLLRERRER